MTRPWAVILLMGWAGLAVSAAAAQPGSPAPADAAVVNSEPITMDAWIHRMKLLRPADWVPAGQQQVRDATAGQIALEQLIQEKLLLQYAGRTSLLPAAKEVDDAVALARQQEAVKKALETGLLSEARLRDDVRAQRTMYNVATVNVRVTPAEVQDCYRRQYAPVERWKLAVIRVSTREAVDGAAAELKKGTPFGQVASRYSEDERTKAKGGELGTVAATDPTIPVPLREAVAKLKPGEVTPPVLAATTASGGSLWFFVKLLGKDTPAAPPFEQVKGQVERLALYTKAGGAAAVARKLAELRKTSTIKVNVPGYEALGTEAK